MTGQGEWLTPPARIRINAVECRKRLIAVLTARAALADSAAGTRDGLVHDAADSPCATPALGAATQAAIDLAGGSRRPLGGERGANVLVGQYIARTDDHGNPGVPARLVRYATIDT